MMTLLRTSLCASALLAGFLHPAWAAPTPADFGALTLTARPKCSAGRPDPLRVAAVLGAGPACCVGRLRCGQYLATTRISRGHELSHT
jgi:hypothetical protein